METPEITDEQLQAAEPQFRNYARYAELAPHQQRVIDEKRELDEKITKLNAFIESSPVFAQLGVQDQDLFKEQRQAMGTYTAILHERIRFF